jgi:hypothetical protein
MQNGDDWPQHAQLAVGWPYKWLFQPKSRIFASGKALGGAKFPKRHNQKLAAKFLAARGGLDGAFDFRSYSP